MDAPTSRTARLVSRHLRDPWVRACWLERAPLEAELDAFLQGPPDSPAAFLLLDAEGAGVTTVVTRAIARLVGRGSEDRTDAGNAADPGDDAGDECHPGEDDLPAVETRPESFVAFLDGDAMAAWTSPADLLPEVSRQLGLEGVSSWDDLRGRSEGARVLVVVDEVHRAPRAPEAVREAVRLISVAAASNLRVILTLRDGLLAQGWTQALSSLLDEEKTRAVVSRALVARVAAGDTLETITERTRGLLAVSSEASRLAATEAVWVAADALLPDAPAPAAALVGQFLSVLRGLHAANPDDKELIVALGESLLTSAHALECMAEVPPARELTLEARQLLEPLHAAHPDDDDYGPCWRGPTTNPGDRWATPATWTARRTSSSGAGGSWRRAGRAADRPLRNGRVDGRGSTRPPFPRWERCWRARRRGRRACAPWSAR